MYCLHPRDDARTLSSDVLEFCYRFHAFCEQSVDRQYKGREFATELPLDPDMIGLLALEAEFRGMNM